MLTNMRTMLRALIMATLCAAGLILAACQAEPASLGGRVLFPSTSGLSFPKPQIKLINTSMDQKDPRAVIGLVTTDDSGHYVFEQLKPGKYSLGVISAMPEGAVCDTPTFLQLDDWIIGTTYSTGAQGERISTLQALYDGAIEIESGDNLIFDLELPIRCDL